MKCPKCESQSTQTIRMVCMAGSSTGASTAVGVDSEGTVGVAKIGTKSQTQLAASLTPGPRPSGNGQLGKIGCGVLLLVCAPFGLASTSLSSEQSSTYSTAPQADHSGVGCAVFFGLVGLALIAWGWSMWGEGEGELKSEVDAWSKKQRLFDHGWICHQCGNTWVP